MCRMADLGFNNEIKSIQKCLKILKKILATRKKGDKSSRNASDFKTRARVIQHFYNSLKNYNFFGRDLKALI